MNVQDALKAREERSKAASSTATASKTGAALDLYKKRRQSESQSAIADIAKRLQAEVDYANKLSEPSFGNGSLAISLESTRENRLNVVNLGKEIEAYKSYWDEETYNTLSSSIKKLSEGYDTYLQSAEIREQFKTQDEFNHWYEQWSAQNAKEQEWQSVLSAPDLDEYIQKGTGVANPTWNKAQAPISIGGWTPFGDGEDIGNMVTFAEANNYNASLSNLNNGSDLARRVVMINQYATDDEKRIYNYYIGKGDTAKANEYLDYLYDQFEQRLGGVISEKVNGTAAEALFSAVNGVNSWFSGVGNIDNYLTGKEADPTNALQYAQGYMGEDNKGAWKVANDVLYTTGNMAPSILISTLPVVGPVAGKVAFGASAIGNAYKEMRDLGYKDWQASGYATLVGASEVVLESLLGGISKLGGKVSLSAGIEKLVGHFDNALAKFAINMPLKMGSEALEEGIQTVLEPAFKAWMTGEKFAAPEWEEIFYSGLLGALSAGVLEGVPGAIGTVGSMKTASEYKSIYGDNAYDLVAESLEIDPENTHAQKMQAKLDGGKQLSGYNIQHLVESKEKTLETQDKAKMKSAVEARLTELGETGDVARLAEVIVKARTEGNLTRAERAILMESKYGRRVSTELNPSVTASGDYTSEWTGNLGTNRIGADVYNRSAPTEAAETAEQAATAVTAEAEQAEANTVTEGEVIPDKDGVIPDTRSKEEQAPAVAVEAPAGTVNQTETVSAPEAEHIPELTEMVSEGEHSVDVNNMPSETTADTVGEESSVSLQEVSAKYGDQAQAMVRTYQEGQDVQQYDSAYQMAYDMGRSGVSLSYVMQSKSTEYLTKQQRELAYEAGQAAAGIMAKAQHETIKAAANGKTGRKKGTVKGEGVTMADLKKTFNDTQNRAYRILAAFAEATGVDIVLYQSKTNENGDFVGAQGKFKRADDKIYIDINAGLQNIKDADDLAKYAMLRTFSHEFTHFLEKYNAVWYNDFRKVVFETLTARGEDANELIETKQAQHPGMDYDKASREVIAEAMTDILPDSQFIETLANKHKNIFTKLHEMLKEFLADIKAYFKSIGHNPSREANALKEQIGEAVRYVDNIVKMFDAGAAAAVDNYQMTVSTDKNTETHYEEVTKYDEQQAKKRTENANTGGNSDDEGTPERTSETDRNRSGISKGLGEAESKLPQSSADERQHRNEEIIRSLLNQENYISPKKGSPLYEVQRILTEEYATECHILKATAWKNENFACAYNGKIYISENIDEDTLKSLVPHESTHIMKQKDFMPYRDFIDNSPQLIDYTTDGARKLFDLISDHMGYDVFETEDVSLIRKYYDELNAVVYGIQQGGLVYDKEFDYEWIPGAFHDFDAYITELSDIHEQYKAEIKAKKDVPEETATQKPDKKGRVYFDGSTAGKTLTERQRASLKALGKIAEALGIDIHIFESPLVDGKRLGENGRYHPDTKQLDIDLHAGAKGDGLMLYTASHELTHHIKNVSPAKFKTFADALLEEYTKHGISLDELIAKKLDHLRDNGRLKGKTEVQAYDLAYEEVVADSCEAMLVDSNAIEALSRKIKSQDKGLWDTIKDFIAKLVARIKAAYDGLNPESYEANIVRDMKDSAERLQRLWVEALVDAGTNTVDIKETESSTAATTQNAIGAIHEDSVYQDRDAEYFSERTFSYDELTAKGDLSGTIIKSGTEVPLKADGSIDAGKIVEAVRDRCQKLTLSGATPTYFVYATDIGRNVQIASKGITHGFFDSTRKNRHPSARDLINAKVSLAIPEILSNSIEVNRSYREGNRDILYSHIMMGAIGIENVAGDTEYYAVRSVIEERRNLDPILVETEILGKLHAVNAKKIDPSNHEITEKNVIRRHGAVYFDYSIAHLLEDVKGVFQDTFSNDVYERLETERENNEFSRNLLYQDRATDSFSNRSLLLNALRGAAQDPKERTLLTNYKKNLDNIYVAQTDLGRIMEQIDKFTKDRSLSIMGEEMSVNDFKERALAKAEKHGIYVGDVKFKLDRTNNRYRAYAIGHGTILEAEKHSMGSDRRFVSAEDQGKLSDLYKEANEISSQISTYDRELLKLEAMEPVRDILKREKKLAYEKAEKRGKEALARQKENQRELMNRYQESRKKGIEGRNKTAMKHKIKNVVKDLDNVLNRGTRDRNVKEEMKGFVSYSLALADVIFSDDITNEDIVRLGATTVTEKESKLLNEYSDLLYSMEALADKRDNVYGLEKVDSTLLAKVGTVEEKIAKIKNRITSLDRELADVFERERARLNRTTATTLMENLAKEYLKLKTSDIEYIRAAYDNFLYEKLVWMVDNIGGTIAKDMSLEQLTEVYHAYKMVAHSVRKANTAHKANKGQTIMQMAEAVCDQVRTVAGQPYMHTAVRSALMKGGWTFLKPYTAFRTIGSVTLTNIYKELRNGEDTFYNDVRDAQEFIEAQYKKHGYKSWDMKQTKTFTAKSGKSFELNLEQMMSIYAYYQRQQAHDHIIGGGIVFEDAVITKKNKLGIPIKYEVTTKEAFNLSEDTFKGICDYLEENHKDVVAYVKEMQAYLSKTMGAKGNEVSMELYGVNLFNEEFYLPIKSSQYYMELSVEDAGEFKLKNSSFSKETKNFANNPIVLHNFTDLWAEHINAMSMYHSFVLALEDFRRVYNYRTKTDTELETMDIKAVLETAYPGATKYISKFLKDMNGGVRGETVGWAEKLTSLAKKGAVLGSASVAIQQPSAVMRAMAYVNPKYFVTTTHKSINLAKHNKDWTELKKYAPIAGIKEMGRFDVGMGQGTVDWIQSNKTKMEVAEDFLSIAPAFMDEVTWVSIWNAVKRETAAGNPKLETSSEAFLGLAGERFTDVISLSQVYDSVFSRSDLMRNKSWIAKSLTAFMAEPSTTLNMIWDSLVQGKRSGSKKGFVKATASAGGAIVAAHVLNAALKSIIMAIRDDDEDEAYIESYLEHFVGDLKDSLNPLGLVPFAKDILSIFQGYDVERMDMALFSDLKKAIDAFDSDEKTIYEKVTGFIGATSAFFGVPFKNVERDIRGFITSIFGESEETTAAGKINAIVEGWKGKETSNGQQLYNAMLKGDKEQIERVRGRFLDDNGKIDESKINSAIRKALRENDPRIKEAATLRAGGDIAGYMKIAKEIIAEGHFKQDDIVAAINAEISAMSEKEESTPSDKAVSLYKIGDYYTSITSGDNATAYAVKNDLIETEIANGKDRDEAEKSFNSSLTSYIQDEFKKGNVTESRAKSMLSYAGWTSEEAASKVQYWIFEKNYPDYDLNESEVSKYYSDVKPAGISLSVYYNYTKKAAKATGVDSNGDGKADRGTKKNEIMWIIHSLPISSYQKDVLYRVNGWAESTLYQAPWH